jgi:endonuclease YncB( thermonuclease family)
VAAPLELNRQILSPELLQRLGESSVEIGREFTAPAANSPERRNFRRRRGRQVAIAAAALVLIAARWQATETNAGGDLPEGRYEVAAVASAETIELANHVEVRLLGLASFPQGLAADKKNPAVAERAAAALDFTRRFVTGGEVRLQFDRTRVDAEGRYLAYVWVDGPRGSRLLNEELLRAGLADPSPQTLSLCSSSMKRRLSQAADAAAGQIPMKR